MSSVLKRKGAQVFLGVALATSALVTPLPASAVPPDKALFGKSLYYRLYLNNENWYNASTKASNLGGHLVSIDTQAEQDFISSNIGTYFSEVMTGLSDLNVDGVYIKPDGTALTYSNFLPGYPYPWGVDQPTAYALVITRTHFNPWESSWSPGQWYSSEATQVYNTSYIDPVSGEFSTGVYAEIPIAFSASQSASPIEGSGLFTTSLFFSAGTGSNLVDGATIYWGLGGISADDLASGTMNGLGVVTNGQLDIMHSLLDDGLDDIENFIVTAYSDPLLRTSEYQIGSYSAPVRSANSSTASVPGPIPLLALSSAFYWTRRLRKRIKNSKEILQISSAD